MAWIKSFWLLGTHFPVLQISRIHGVGRLRLQMLALHTWPSASAGCRRHWPQPGLQKIVCPQANAHSPSDRGNASPAVPLTAGISEGTHQSHHLLCGATPELLHGTHVRRWEILTKQTRAAQLSLVDSKPHVNRKHAGKYRHRSTFARPRYKAPTTPSSFTSCSESRKGRQLAGGLPRGLAPNQRRQQEPTPLAVASARHHWRTARAVVQNVLTGDPTRTDQATLTRSSRRAGARSTPRQSGPRPAPPSTTCRQLRVSTVWHDLWKFSRGRMDTLLLLNKSGNRHI